MRKVVFGVSLFSLALVGAGPVLAQDLELSGSISGELRTFPQSPQFADQDDRALEASVALEPEFRAYFDNDLRITVIPFLRVDEADSDERTHFDLREASAYYEASDWDATIGLSKVYWGVAESRHLVDVVNQSDSVEDVDGEDKLGQPMVNVNFLRDWGTVGLFVLPGFRERTFPGDSNRLRGSLPIDEDQTRYESGQGKRHVDFAARYSHYFGDWDVGLSHFYGTSRDPRFIEVTTADGKSAFAPVYDLIHQTGVDIQYTSNEWLWKFEGIRHGGFQTSDSFFALVGGVEYTLYGVAESDADLGLLAEFLWDDRKAGSAGTFLERDVFTGMRLALNDAESTEALVGVITDVSTGEMLFSAEAERRIGDNMKAELESRFFFNTDAASQATTLKDDGQVTLRLNWYF